jgi:hypothetical protein
MKQRILPLLAAGTTLCCLDLLPLHAAGAKLIPTADTVSVGGTLQVQVWADCQSEPIELAAFGFDVDPGDTLSFLTYDGYTLGPEAADASDPSNPKNVSGLYFPAATDSEVLLATLAFTGKAAGTETLMVQGLVSDLAGLFFTESLSPFDPVEFDIDASETLTVVPEPSSILAVVSGLTGFVAWRRRRRSKSSARHGDEAR